MNPGTTAARLGVAACAAVAVPALAVTLGIADLIALARRRDRGRTPHEFETIRSTRASFIVLNWNGRHLLERGLPSIVAAAREGDEIIVVDNGSTDDSLTFVRATFPTIRLVELPSNLGFSAGNNAGARVARNDVIVLLNSDMVVEPDFVAPLIEALRQPDVFAATSQIFRLDPAQTRHETGRTAAEFVHGSLALAHVPVDDDAYAAPHSILWAGGGSSAYDRRKFLALGGLDELYSPAYVEDLALSYAAWKRGWASVFVSTSRVLHEHRGTSRRVFGDAYVDCLISRNQLLFMWRHMSWKYLRQHLAWLPAHADWLATQHSAGSALEILLTALRRLPVVAVGRATDRERRILSDDQILGKSAIVTSGEPFAPGPAQPGVRINRGWYALEDSQTAAFRWTGRRADAVVNVEHLPSEVRVGGYVPEMLLRGGRDVRLRIALEPDIHQTCRFRSPGPFVATVPIPAGPLGWRRLSLALDRSTRPAAQGIGADVRELGIQIFEINLHALVRT